MNGRPWTAAEVKRLRIFVNARMPIKDIMVELDRSRGSVTSKIREAGIANPRSRANVPLQHLNVRVPVALVDRMKRRPEGITEFVRRTLAKEVERMTGI
jgi:hypothetical protein